MAKHRRRAFITTGDFDPAKYPIPPARIERSAAECRHTPTPKTYHARWEWNEQADAAGYSQVRCPHCGLWKIWLPKKEATKVNKQDEKDQAKFLAEQERWMREQSKVAT